MRYREAIRTGSALLAAALLAGCFSGFKPLESDFRAKGRTIAVIPGTTDNISAGMAQYVGESLQKQSRYHVLTQKHIAKTLGVYPQNIKGPYRSAYFDIDVDWSMTDRQKVAGIQKALGVDYLYVIWAPTAVRMNNSKTAQLHVIAQLFESPASKEVGRSMVPLRTREKDPEVLQKDVDRLTSQIAERTGMLRGTEQAAK